MNESKMNDLYDLGAWSGRRQAFGLLSGKCSAADAECLRRIRQERKYRALGMSWKQFCEDRIGVSKAGADKIIRQLDELGPKYFELAAVVRITPEQYRGIAGAVTDGGIVHEGRLLPISVDNSAELSAAVEALRRETAPPQLEAPEGDETERALARARKAMDATVAAFEQALSTKPSGVARYHLRAEVGKAGAEMARLASMLR